MIIPFIKIIFILSTLIQFLFWWVIFVRLAFYKTPSQLNNTEIPVTIIICAKNEAKNLKKNLDRIINQNYRLFEILVVDDHSTDNTWNVLMDFVIKNPYLRIIKNDNIDAVGKKSALTTGILSAKYDTVLLTDADCQPQGKYWLKEMTNLLTHDTDIVLGYGPYLKREGFLNKFIRFETVMTAVQYFSFALSGIPYMGVGRNLMYKKKLFFKADGFTKHRHIASGDDDLFIQDVINKSNFKIALNEKTFMYSEPKLTWKSYYRQKMRHTTTGTSYKPRIQAFLGLYALTHFLHYIGGAVLFFYGTKLVVLLILARMMSILIIHWFILKKLNESLLLKWIPILDISFIFYYIAILPSIVIGKNDKWT